MSSPTFPHWIRRTWPAGGRVQEVKDLLAGLRLHTVCQSAQCPNHAECWERRTATFLVLGNICTRHCSFCAVNSGAPGPLDPEEPDNVAEAARRLNLGHVVITTVTRDDLPDGGAAHLARTVIAVKQRHPRATVEVLAPDFGGNREAIRQVLETGVEVFGHNLETVARLHPLLRDRRYNYHTSLEVLRLAAAMAPERFIKSGLMLGCGETDDEIRDALQDLRAAGCRVVTMGQYLQPTRQHRPVARYVTLEKFKQYEALAWELGFAFAVAGPFVRSSYRSEQVFSRSTPITSRIQPGVHPNHAL